MDALRAMHENSSERLDQPGVLGGFPVLPGVLGPVAFPVVGIGVPADVPVVRIDELAAGLHDHRLHARRILADDALELGRVELRIGPVVVVVRDQHLGLEGLADPEEIPGGHLVGRARRVVAHVGDRDVDPVLVPDRLVAIVVERVAQKKDVPGIGFEQVAHRRLAVGAGLVYRHAGAAGTGSSSPGLTWMIRSSGTWNFRVFRMVDIGPTYLQRVVARVALIV